MKKKDNRPAADNNQPEKKTKARKKRKLSPLARVLIIIVLICIIAGSIVAAVLTVYILKYIGSDDTLDLTDVKLSYSTILYAMDESTGEYYEFHRLHDVENRIWVDYDDIPQDLVNGFIALEDKRFPYHHGVDWKRTIGAAVNLFIPIYEGKPGGSTITQQLIKNVTGDNAVRVDRKVREIFQALNLEKRYSKEQIMEAYLNTIALGSGTNGVQAAANLYFGKDVKDLNLAECASLVAITKNPSVYNPFYNPENNKSRQEDCLYMMHEQGYINDEEYEEALNYPLEFKKEEHIEKINDTQSWFVDYVTEEVINDLVEEKGYTKEYAESQIYKGGYRIYTTIDVEMQDYLEEVYLYNTNTFPAVYNAEYPESAFVITDLHGGIKALAGSNRPKEGARLFNRATSARRHPGSTIKPIASYSPAFEQDLITWSTLFNDAPLEISPGKYWPTNFYSGYYENPITVEFAIRRSANTIPAQLVEMMGPRTSFDFLKNKLNMYNLVERETINGRVVSDIDRAPMALGALSVGVTPLEMAGAYQIFGNGGTFTPTHSYTKVLDSNGEVVLEKDLTPTRVISPETSTVMNRLLQQVTTAPQGTGTTAKFGAMPVAGKTGTSEYDYNQWFIGVTPYYVGACWMGYDTDATIRYASYPPPIVWKNVMGPIHQNLAVVDFPTYGDVSVQTYCMETGLLAGEDCANTASGWYDNNNLPEVCDGTHPVPEDEDNEDEEDDSSSESSSSSRRDEDEDEDE